MISKEEFSLPIKNWFAARQEKGGLADDWSWVGTDLLTGHLSAPAFCAARFGAFPLPDQALRNCAAVYYQNQSRWMAWQPALEALFGHLYRAGIDVMPFKGWATQRYYLDRGSRQMGDVDLLIREEQYIKAAIEMVNAGYCLHPDNHFLSISDLSEVAPSMLPSEIIFQNSDGVVIELHRNLVSSTWFESAFPIPLDGIWQRAEQLPDRTYRMNLSDEVLSLCLHLTLHGLNRPALHSFLDLDLLVRSQKERLDWDEISRLLNASRLAPAAGFVFTFLKNVLQSPVPEPHKIAGGFSGKSILFSTDSLLNGHNSPGMRYPTLVKFLLVEGFNSKMKLLTNLLFPAPDWRKFRYRQQTSLPHHWKMVAQTILRGD